MVDLATRINRLEDLEAIRGLIASYGPAADIGDAQAVAEIWWEDGEYDVGGFGVSRGHAAIAALIESDTHRQLMANGCAHILSAHEIALSGDRAEASGYSTVFVKRGDGYDAWRVSRNDWIFEKRAGKWRALSRINRPVEGEAKGEEAE